MFEKIVEVKPMNNYVLKVVFKNGEIRIFDMKPEIEKRPYYAALRNNPELFAKVRPIGLGSAVGWNDDIDMASEWIWEHGEVKFVPDDEVWS